LSIALKEANETEYWLALLKNSKYIETKQFTSIQPEISEIMRLLISSIKTVKKSVS